MNRFCVAVVFLLTLAAAPALAQQRISIGMEQGGADEKVSQAVVYGDDPCPVSASGEITVCARRPEEERYRIPEGLREIDRPQGTSWTSKVEDYEATTRGGGCSAAGFMGMQGCWQQFIDRAFRERRNGSGGRYAKLIQAERDKRLARIDAEAKAEQARVEEAEKAYFARQEGQAAAAEAAPTSAMEEATQTSAQE